MQCYQVRCKSRVGENPDVLGGSASGDMKKEKDLWVQVKGNEKIIFGWRYS